MLYTIHDHEERDFVMRGRPDEARKGWTPEESWHAVGRMLHSCGALVRRLPDYPTTGSSRELQVLWRAPDIADERANCFLYATTAAAEFHVPEADVFRGEVESDARRLVNRTQWAIALLSALGATSFEFGRDAEELHPLDQADPHSWKGVMLRCIATAHAGLDTDLTDPSAAYGPVLVRLLRKLSRAPRAPT